jgi:hypothetical protein
MTVISILVSILIFLKKVWEEILSIENIGTTESLQERTTQEQKP